LKIHYRLLGILFILLLSGCVNQQVPTQVQHTTNNPTPLEVLKEHPNADIFLFKGVVYRNAEDIDWVKKLDLKQGEQLGEITAVYKDNVEFKQWMATKLPVGTKLYKTDTAKGPFILVQTDTELVPYLGVVEG